MTAGELLHIVEIRTKVVSVSSFLIGTAYAAVSGEGFSWTMAGLMFAAVVCVDLGTTGFNSYYDFIHGVDTRESDLDGDKVLLRGRTRPGLALAISSVCFLAAAALGMMIGYLVGWWIVGVGAVCMAVGYLYSGGPFPLSRTPLGELLAGGFMGGVLVVLSFAVQTGHLTSGAVWLSLPSSVLIGAILSVNNTCDIEGDRRGGRRTLSILLGVRRAEWVVYGLAVMAFLLAFGLIGVRVLPPWAALPLTVAALISGGEFRSMHQRGYSHATKGRAMASISKVFVLFTVALLIGLLPFGRR
jgi:1,4-dihydroxy-2-naphthoate octaprenyltransferase